MRTSISEVKFLEICQIALTNVEKQPRVAVLMAELGYDINKLNEGRVLLKDAQRLYAANRLEHIEASIAYAKFEELVKNILKDYSMMRKKAKVIFRNEPLLLVRLKLDGVMPIAYVNKIHIIRLFLSEILSDESIQRRLMSLKIIKDDLLQLNNELDALDDARARYLKEKGESQNVTSLKDKSFAGLDDWMSEFYAIVKIALEDEPQLMELLGKIVK